MSEKGNHSDKETFELDVTGGTYSSGEQTQNLNFNSRKNSTNFSGSKIPKDFLTKGDMEKSRIQWKDINISVKTKSGEKQILFNQNGYAESGEVLAIIGASGSGKTTLLNYISGYIDFNFNCGGDISIGGDEELTRVDRRNISGYVLQEDILQSELTVYEAIEYSARFRLPGFVKKKNLTDLVNHLIEVFDLERCKDTRIGETGKRGISGGEKKKTAIAAEVVTNPKILILDEPTTGLDSVNAENVVETMKKLAKLGKVVISTIHQPSIEMLKNFDKVLILHEGKKIYHGSYLDMRLFFSKKGINIPRFVNPVEYLMNILNITENTCEMLTKHVSEKFHDFYNKDVIENMVKVVEENQNMKGEFTEVVEEEKENFKTYIKKIRKENSQAIKGFFKSFILIFELEFKIFFRSKMGFLALLLASLVQAGLACILFWDMKYDVRGIQNRKGAVYFVMSFITMVGLQVSAFTFSKGSKLMKKELMQGQYTPNSYFWGKTVPQFFPLIFIMIISVNVIFFAGNMNFVTMDHYWNYIVLSILAVISSESLGLMVGASVSNSEQAVAVIPIVVTPLMLFAGLQIDIGSIPKYIAFFKYISFYRYVFEGMVINEFSDLNGCKDDICNVPKEQLSFDNSVLFCMNVLGCIFGIVRCLALLIFYMKYKKYSVSK